MSHNQWAAVKPIDFSAPSGTSSGPTPLNTIPGMELYSCLFHANMDCLLICSYDTTTDRLSTITEANNAAETLTGYSREELFTLHTTDIEAPVPDEIIAQRHQLLREYGSIEFETEFIRKDSIRVPVEIRVVTFRFPGETMLLAMVRDISPKKRQEAELQKHMDSLEVLYFKRSEELRKANILLEHQLEWGKHVEALLKEAYETEKAANYSKARFLSTVSHEFRTPLTTILASAELLQRGGALADAAKSERHLAKIMSSVEYMRKLLEDVASYSISETNDLVIHYETIYCNEFCGIIRNDIGSFLGENQSLQITVNSQIRQIQSDPQLLRVILTNLLSNAIKYSLPDGQIALRFELQKNELIIQVADNGIGIPTEAVRSIWDPFFRAQNVESIPGSGLGLSIVFRAVTLLKGRITVKSTLHQGTEFTIYLPLEIEGNEEQ